MVKVIQVHNIHDDKSLMHESIWVMTVWCLALSLSVWISHLETSSLCGLSLFKKNGNVLKIMRIITE